ncbi:MAG: hypothetical protein AAF495_03605 [Pseudomonadota bacterium]
MSDEKKKTVTSTHSMPVEWRSEVSSKHEMPIEWAVSSLSTTVASAVKSHHSNVAHASADLQQLVVNVFVPEESRAPITDEQIETLKQRIEALEEAINKDTGRDVARTHTFQCKQDFDDCMAKAETKGEKGVCWAMLGACVGVDYTTLVGD